MTYDISTDARDPARARGGGARGTKWDVAIVGAGLAGLVCAHDLQRAGVSCTVLEASDGVGGRVRTDVESGYLLDRGFQILLTAYPQISSRIDVPALALGRFDPGAAVYTARGTHVLADPRRRPAALWSTLTAPIASAPDRLRTLRLVADVLRHDVPTLLRRPDASTSQRLARAGFSSGFIESFWRPLFAGIQLDPELEVSSRRFETVLRMLVTGATGLPRLGIGAVPAQIAAELAPGTVRTGCAASAVAPGRVRVADGEEVRARAIVVATDGPAAHRLLPAAVRDPGSRPVACCWFAAAAPPRRGRLLMLDGEGTGPALNVVVISEVQPSYAPPGRALIAAAVPGPAALEPKLSARVREQLARWFGAATRDFELLRTDVIAHGQPDPRPPLSPRRRVELGDGLFVCGDHRDTASVQGAMFSGERTAAAVLRRLSTARA